MNGSFPQPIPRRPTESPEAYVARLVEAAMTRLKPERMRRRLLTSTLPALLGPNELIVSLALALPTERMAMNGFIVATDSRILLSGITGKDTVVAYSLEQIAAVRRGTAIGAGARLRLFLVDQTEVSVSIIAPRAAAETIEAWLIGNGATQGAPPKTEQASSETPEVDPETLEAIEQALQRAGVGAGRLLSRGLYKRLPSLLQPGETPLLAADSQFTDSIWSGRRTGEDRDQKFEGGYLVVTDRRVIALGTGGMGLMSRGAKSVPLRHILSVDTTRTMGQGIFGGGAPMRLHLASGVMDFRVINTAAADRICTHLTEVIVGGTATPPPSASPGAANQSEAPVAPAGPVAELAQIAELHAAGVLDDAEFAAAKERILRRL